MTAFLPGMVLEEASDMQDTIKVTVMMMPIMKMMMKTLLHNSHVPTFVMNSDEDWKDFPNR